MHALNGKNIPYALNDDDDELDDNNSDDVFNDDDDENDHDHDHHSHIFHCHHDYRQFHHLFIITFGIINSIYQKYVISGKGSWRTHTIYE